MAHALPSTGDPGPAEGAGCDTSDMLVIHRLIRSSFDEAPGLIDGVADGDRGRAEIVGAHVDALATSLHGHHHSEDTVLWDELERRAPSCAIHIGRMRAQHAEMAEHLAELQAALPAWRSSGSKADAAPVRAALDGVLASLGVHLPDEETSILPVAQRAMSQKAWDRLGEAGRASVPKDKVFIQLGFILDSIPEAERQKWKQDFLPLPARVLYAIVGRRQYERYRARLYGTAA